LERIIAPLSDVAITVVTGLSLQNVADAAVLDVFVSRAPRRVGHRLHADRDGATVLHRGIDDRDRFLDRARHRLFHVHVFAVFHGVERHPGVPVVRRRDKDHVDVLVLEDGAVVFRDTSLAGVRGDAARLGARVEPAAGAVLLVAAAGPERFVAIPHVAHRERIDRLAFVAHVDDPLDLLLAGAAGAKEADAALIVGGANAGVAAGGQRQRGPRGRAAGDERSAIHGMRHGTISGNEGARPSSNARRARAGGAAAGTNPIWKYLCS